MNAALRIAALSAAASLVAGTATADLTAAEVWASWQEGAQGLRQTLSVGAIDEAPGVLTLRDVSFTTEAPDGGGNMTIFEVVMTERGDGTVAVTMSPEIPMDFTSLGADGEPVNFSLVLEPTDLDLVASGEAGAISYAFSAPQVIARLGEISLGDETAEVQGAMTITAMEGTSTVTSGEMRETQTDLTIGSLDFRAAGVDPAGTGDSFDIGLRLNDIVSESDGTVSPLMSMASLPEMIAAGFSSASVLTHGAATFTVSGTSEGSGFALNGGYRSGAYDISIGGDGMDYDYVAEGFDFSFRGDDIPFLEFTMAVEELGSRIAMPFAVTEEPSEVAFGIRFVGLTLGDAVWAMIDPMGGIPRDPATLILDLTGQANWLVDIFDPAVAEGPMDSAPGEIHSVSVNELRLAAAGAELSGTGDFDFDNSMGVPMPAGSLNLRLVGGNALIDLLVNTGMLPADQAMGARMMLGLFARPGDGPDTLVSEIRVEPDGSIFANGQQLQ